MAKNFSKKEADELLKAHQSVLNALLKVCSFGDVKETEIKRIVSEASNRNEFISFLNDELVLNKEAEFTDRMKKILTLLYHYLSTAKEVRDGNVILKERGNYAKLSITYLNSCKSSLQWMFSGKDVKKRSEESFKYLSLLMKGSYPEDVYKLSEIVDQCEKTSYQEIYGDFLENRKSYISALRLIVKNEHYKEEEKVSKLLSDLQDARLKLKEVTDSYEMQKASVIKAAESYAAKQSYDMLKEVSVDELSKRKSGIRVKLLHDHGYDTVSDILGASTENLEAVKGISYEGAVLIKKEAKEMLKEASKGVKIKLSSDDRDKESEELILQIYIYRKMKEHEKNLMELMTLFVEGISDKLERLKTVVNGVYFFLLSPGQKRTLQNDYSFLHNVSTGGIYKVLSDLSIAVQKAKKTLSNDAWKEFTLNPIPFINILEEVIPGILGNDDVLFGLPEELFREINEENLDKSGLKCSLRRYQEYGVKYILHQKKVLLGDEMGLGKTVQAIATMVSLKNTGEKHFMVICPASVISNWVREIRKHSDLQAVKIHGERRQESFLSWMRLGGVAVTTYETTGMIQMPEDFRFSLLTVDEAHYIKNQNTKRTRNVDEIIKHADRLLFMTGTALENRVSEMISILEKLDPEIAKKAENMAFMSTQAKFRETVAPIYYRRKREDVLTELPDLFESEEWVDLSIKEEMIYEARVLSKNFTGARRVSFDIPDIEESAKFIRMKELIEEAKGDGRKVIIFSFFLDTIKKVYDALSDISMPPITGAVSAEKRQDIIDEFNEREAGTVLPLQIQAGGTGLNIQSASVVILCEPQLKPSIENQAISRAYRMGQSRNVLVYRLLAENTIEERIMDLLKAKTEIFEAFADKSVAADSEETDTIDEKTVSDLIQEEIDRINEKKKEENLLENVKPVDSVN